jgi:hypothetical protein
MQAQVEEYIIPVAPGRRKKRADPVIRKSHNLLPAHFRASDCLGRVATDDNLFESMAERAAQRHVDQQAGARAFPGVQFSPYSAWSDRGGGLQFDMPEPRFDVLACDLIILMCCPWTHRGPDGPQPLV